LLHQEKGGRNDNERDCPEDELSRFP